MIVKIIYPNGCWEYFKNVTSIERTFKANIMVVNNQKMIRLDSRIKLEVVL